MSHRLSEIDIASMRDTSEEFMQDLVLIERPTEVRNPAGGLKKTWSTVAVDAPCDIISEADAGEEGAIGGRRATQTIWYVYIGVDQDVQPSDRLTDQYGRMFTVNSVGDPVAGSADRSTEIALAVTKVQ